MSNMFVWGMSFGYMLKIAGSRATGQHYTSSI